MMLNSTKMLFIMFMFISTLISTSSNNWLSGWLGLEINLMAFIPIMYSKLNYYSSESSMKYFIIQSSSSMILLLGIILSSLKINMNLSMMVMMCGLLTKLGVAPFHMWVPSIMEGMNWINCLILSTWQKIAPLILISYSINNNMLIIPAIFSLLIGSIGGLNQSSIKKLMAYSSINNIGWILISMLMSMMTWINYFMIYSLMISMFMYMLNKENINYINQCFLCTFKSMNKIFFLIMLLSMGGLPPMLGFMPKWMIIQLTVMSNMYIVTLVMVTSSLVVLFYYIQMSFSMLMINSQKLKWTEFSIMNNKMMILSFFINMFGFILITLIKSMT
uniref:NADH-ubiquinone oxidoreductase chain 2 n=1 Tax=Phymatostetha punctata TaxID=2653493 RepID=A0A5J6XGL4_9HEMI|nr:NADH dehydrogenase subunit 2 [Phymatostetha punctata]QFK69087.1 NADH dehydrogenase subunit 2 [Phymatostetha punctata]